MKKKIIIFITTVITLSFISFYFLGPKYNDDYAVKSLEILHSASLPSNIKSREFSKYIGYSEENFTIWIGFIVETELEISELNAQILNIIEFQNIVISSYDHKTAAHFGFTGIQKEIIDQSTDNYYIIGITIKLQTYFDKKILKNF